MFVLILLFSLPDSDTSSVDSVNVDMIYTKPVYDLKDFRLPESGAMKFGASAGLGLDQISKKYEQSSWGETHYITSFTKTQSGTGNCDFLFKKENEHNVFFYTHQ